MSKGIMNKIFNVYIIIFELITTKEGDFDNGYVRIIFT